MCCQVLHRRICCAAREDVSVTDLLFIGCVIAQLNSPCRSKSEGLPDRAAGSTLVLANRGKKKMEAHHSQLTTFFFWRHFSFVSFDI